MDFGAMPDESISSLRRNARVLLRPEETANALGISRARLFELLADGRIRSLKIGRSRRVPVAELERWVAAELESQSS